MYIVKDIATIGSRKGEPIYLSGEFYRDGGNRLHRKWVFEVEHAQKYTFEYTASSAAAQYGGAVERIVPVDAQIV